MQRVLANGLAMRDKVVHGAEHADDPVPSHSKVLDRIRAKDAPGAEEAMRALLDKANEDFDRIAATATATSTEPRRAG
jgi:GntR family transcriptional regulator, galactonate operon transcriptional repressor